MQWAKAWSFGRALYSDIIREKLTKLGFERNGSTWPLVIRFNMLDEQLFVCQSLLKERRRPPTGGLLEALNESLGRGIHALFPCCGVEKNDPWSL